MPEETRLRIYGRSEFEVGAISLFLLDLEHAYNCIYAFDDYILNRRSYRYEPGYRYYNETEPLISWLTGRRSSAPRENRPIRLVEITEIVNQGRSFVPQPDRIRLGSVELHSPGVWEFLGTLNPLEVIRKYLNDRHERQKDRDYRSLAEQRKLELQNISLETKVIKERIKLAREAGVPENQITYIVSELLEAPLSRLGSHEQKGLIGPAQIVHRKEPPEWRTFDENE